MATLLLGLVARANGRVQMNWIMDQRSDMLWFIGGTLAGYAMFFLHAGLHLDMITVWFLWVVFLDSPHFFGTYSRTYLDREEWRERRKLLIGSLGWFLVGPTVILLSFVLYRIGNSQYTVPYLAFVVFFNLWAYWHIVRQHYGIMALYQRKNADVDPLDKRLDNSLLYVGLLAPFVAFIVRHLEARTALGLPGNMPPYPPLAADGIVSRIVDGLSPEYLGRLSWEHVVVAVSVAAVATVVAAFLGRQVQRWQQRLPLNLPKILFLAAVIPLHVSICYSPAVLTAPLLAFSAFVTVYHDIQYYAIVWFHHRNRYHRPGVDAQRYGWAVKVSRSFGTFLLCGIAMAAVFRLLGCALEAHPGCPPLVLTSKRVLFGNVTVRHLLISVLLGFPLHHYFLDQFIWRPSRDRRLQEDLKLNR
ncbi:MAG: hypothetical protein HY347_05545 [candidate division NC10 bacterium]|nr:hypothetical protein [candidate division NC10 bacterium]